MRVACKPIPKAEGIYSEKPPCTQLYSCGIYQIPFCSLYSRSIPDLFFAGRIFSASHIAFGASRVMLTWAHSAETVGETAALRRHSATGPS